jgi:hypothetical protein
MALVILNQKQNFTQETLTPPYTCTCTQVHIHAPMCMPLHMQTDGHTQTDVQLYKSAEIPKLHDKCIPNSSHISRNICYSLCCIFFHFN